MIKLYNLIKFDQKFKIWDNKISINQNHQYKSFITSIKFHFTHTNIFLQCLLINLVILLYFFHNTIKILEI